MTQFVVYQLVHEEGFHCKPLPAIVGQLCVSEWEPVLTLMTKTVTAIHQSQKEAKQTMMSRWVCARNTLAAHGSVESMQSHVFTVPQGAA